MSKENKCEYALPEGYVLKGGANDYVIEKVLGKGGFGITYKVKSRILYQNIHVDVHFAVKEYFPDNCWRDNDNSTLKAPPTKHQDINDGIQDFIYEGHRLQQLCKLNPNIVNVNEVFEANGTAYYVLEFLEGGSLAQLVRDSAAGHLTEQQMIEVMMPVGRALQSLHDNHMLHLDIKPDNIVMRLDNGNKEPVLIDFGIAIHFNDDSTPTSKTPSSGISPGFSPIEQYSQIKFFDPRLDVYAFSATCLYLLTGKVPIEAMNMPADFVRNTMPAGVSERVATAIERGMSKEKEHRTSSIAELLAGFVPCAVPDVPPLPSAPSSGVATRVSSSALPPPPPIVTEPVSAPAAPPQPVIPVSVAPEQEYVEEPYSSAYKPDGGKKRLPWAIIGGLLVAALLAGIAIWSMKGCSSSSDKSGSDAQETSAESLSGYYDETGDNSIASAPDASTMPSTEQVPEEKAVTAEEVKNEQPKDDSGAKDKNDKSATETYNTSQSAPAQPQPQSSKPNDEIFMSAAHMPSFPGGDAGLMNIIRQNLRYPAAAADNGVQGKVIVQFVVEKNGRVGEVKVARSVDPALDREAVRVCKMLPAFSPGRNAVGDPVRVWYTLPITFKL